MKIYLLTLIAVAGFMMILTTAIAQNTFPSTGRVGIYTTSPASSLQVKGGARIGTLTNYVNIDSATGNLSFVGTSAYQVGGNKYAFQYTSNPNYGLFFNSSAVQYEFRNGSAVPVFSVNANTGNSVFNGTLKVGAYTLPATDGTSGQVLKTNGSGVVSWNADNGNAYTAGTGISISGTTITNTAPDKTVALTAGTGISVTGTYPNFTVTNTTTPWSITGNANTDSAINFIGTTNAQALVFKVNNLRSGFIGYSTSNTSFGYQTLISNTTGNYNTATGTDALLTNKQGSNNTANGSYALLNNTTGNYNVATGSDALHNNTTGYYNTANGSQSLYTNTYGFANTSAGYQSLYFNTSGYQNTATGLDALYANTSGYNNVATGLGALLLNNSGNSNTADGYSALSANTSGNNNTAVGNLALLSNTTGYSNVALGVSALSSSTTSSNQIAVGDSALFHQNGASSFNMAIGSKALYSNTNGSSNCAIGYHTLYNNTIGYSNTATGNGALYGNTSGGENTANGLNALSSNTTGSFNTAIGLAALYSNTTGNWNTGTGHGALQSNSIGSDNTAVGYRALFSTGVGAVQSYDAVSNTAIGNESLYNNNIGYNNTASGDNALYSNTTGYNNAAYGLQALQSNIDGIGNTAVGVAADENNGSLQNATAIGYFALSTASNQVRIGNSNVSSIGGYVNWSNISDGRVKKNIKQNVPGLSFINKLNPVTYNLDLNAADKIIQIPQLKDKDGKTKQPSQDELDARKAKEQVLYTGFIAQDVEKAAKSLNYDFSGVDAAKNSKDLYGLRYAEFVVPLVKAVQELSALNNAKDAKIDTLQNQLNELKTLVLSIQQKQDQCSPCNASVDTKQAQSFTTVLTDDVSLQQNVPNPFGNTTLVGYRLPQKFSSARILIFDKTGKTIKAVTISGGGKGSLMVDASLLSAGAYNYSLVVDGRLVATKQMILAR